MTPPLFFVQRPAVFFPDKSFRIVSKFPLYGKYFYLFFQNLKFVSFLPKMTDVAKVHTVVSEAPHHYSMWTSPAPEESPTCGPV